MHKLLYKGTNKDITTTTTQGDHNLGHYYSIASQFTKYHT